MGEKLTRAMRIAEEIRAEHAAHLRWREEQMASRCEERAHLIAAVAGLSGHQV